LRAIRCEQSRKQDAGIVTLAGGREIDRSDVQHSNADSPTTDSFELGSHATFRRPMQYRKQQSEILSTDEGMQID
jgi:hypothetical protein